MRLIVLILIGAVLDAAPVLAQDAVLNAVQLHFSPARVVLDGDLIVDTAESNPLNPGEVILAGKRGVGLFSLSAHAFDGSTECGSLSATTLRCTIGDHEVEVTSHTRLVENGGEPVPIYGRIDPYEPRPGHMEQTLVSVVSLDVHAAMMGGQ